VGLHADPKGTYRASGFEISGGVGPTLYYSRLEQYERAPGAPDFDVRKTTIGFHGEGGFGIDIASAFQIGASSRFMWTDKVQYQDLRLDLVALTVRGHVRFRF
jgi:hypothetical protein